jgi:hypothetical protein
VWFVIDELATLPAKHLRAWIQANLYLNLADAPFDREDTTLKGFLTGKNDASTEFDSTDFRAIVPRFSKENRKANQALVDVVTEFAQQKKRLLHKSRSHGCSPKSHGSVELSIEDVRAREEASSAIKVEGERYPATHAKLIDR